MTPTLRNLWRMYLLEFQKVGWDILGVAYVANAMILFTDGIVGVAHFSVALSVWIALRLYLPDGARQRMEYEACLPVPWVCAVSARFCVLASAWVLLFILPAFLLEDMRGVRMVGWLARHLPEGNAVAVIERCMDHRGPWLSPWLWLNGQSGALLFASIAAAVVFHVPRGWKIVAVVVLAAVVCALAMQYGARNEAFGRDYFERQEFQLFNLMPCAWFWPVNLACAAVLLLVKATPFSKRGGVL